MCLSGLEAELVALTLLQALDKPHDEIRLALLDSAYSRAQAASAVRLKAFMDADGAGDFFAAPDDKEETHADFEARVKEAESDV